MTEEELAAKETVVDQCLTQLGEHFEAVQIFVSVMSDDGQWTHSISKGAGNLYARAGQAQRWLHWQEEETRGECRKNQES
jgi:hypothetical protein